MHLRSMLLYVHRRTSTYMHAHIHRYGYLRSRDREIHGIKGFPKLFYPELYVMKYGYKRFFAEFPDLCEPRSYVPMEDEDYVEVLVCVYVHFNAYIHALAYVCRCVCVLGMYA